MRAGWEGLTGSGPGLVESAGIQEAESVLDWLLPRSRGIR